MQPYHCAIDHCFPREHVGRLDLALTQLTPQRQEFPYAGQKGETGDCKDIDRYEDGDRKSR